MFVRCKMRRKDGKEHRYWSVVENVRVRGGRVVQRQVLYLGEINDSQRAAWCRSIAVLDETASARQLALFPADRGRPGAGLRGGADPGHGRAGARSPPMGRMLAGADRVGSAGVGPVLGTALAAEPAGDAVAGRVEGAGLLPAHRSGERLAAAPALVCP